MFCTDFSDDPAYGAAYGVRAFFGYLAVPSQAQKPT